MNIEYYGNDAIVSTDKVVYSYSVKSPEEFRELKEDRRIENLNWTEQVNYIGDFVVFPHGNHNDLPKLIRDVITSNYIAPGLLKKKTNLLWGKGPRLYEERFENGVLIRDWKSDSEIESWLADWDYEDYLLKQCVDFHVIEGTYSKFYRARGYRIAKPFIAQLEHLSADETRLATTKSNYYDQKKKEPTHAIVNDWGFNSLYSLTDAKAYPLFSHKDPFRHRHSVVYSNIPTFCIDFYSLPDIYGSLEWIRRSTSIPLIFKALSKHGINQVFHVESPSKYWDRVKDRIETRCTERGIKYKDEMLQEYKENLLTKITEVLSGAENSGKLWHTEKIYDTDGVNIIEAGWVIKPIDQKTKDFVEAQVKIKNAADHAVGTGLQLHPALGGITEAGKSDSGSEQLYALKNYLLTGIDIPEKVVCKSINYAIKSNWPNTKLRLGFYHESPQREQDVTSKDRIVNQVP